MKPLDDGLLVRRSIHHNKIAINERASHLMMIALDIERKVFKLGLLFATTADPH